jgi:hypothetical protein
MLGRLHSSHCPACRGVPGPDFPDIGKSTRQAKCAERRRAREDILNELVRDAEDSGLYESTAYPRSTR